MLNLCHELRNYTYQFLDEKVVHHFILSVFNFFVRSPFSSLLIFLVQLLAFYWAYSPPKASLRWEYQPMREIFLRVFNSFLCDFQAQLTQSIIGKTEKPSISYVYFGQMR